MISYNSYILYTNGGKCNTDRLWKKNIIEKPIMLPSKSNNDDELGLLLWHSYRLLSLLYIIQQWSKATTSIYIQATFILRTLAFNTDINTILNFMQAQTWKMELGMHISTYKFTNYFSKSERLCFSAMINPIKKWTTSTENMPPYC